MKVLWNSLIIVVILLNGLAKAEILQDKPQEADSPLERKLSATRFLDQRLLQNTQNISVQKIRDKIIDTHKNVKLCIDSEFDKDKEQMLAFKDILRGCVGDNYSIVLKFYDDINSYIRELTKDHIKCKLRNGFCDDNLIECLEYFQTIELFIDKDFDLMKSLEFNKAELSRKIGTRLLSQLMKVTEDELEDYNIIREDLLDERKFLNEYFTERYEEYIKKYGSANANGTLL